MSLRQSAWMQSVSLGRISCNGTQYFVFTCGEAFWGSLLNEDRDISKGIACLLLHIPHKFSLSTGLEGRRESSESLGKGADRFSNGRCRYEAIMGHWMDATKCSHDLCSVSHRISQYPLGAWMQVKLPLNQRNRWGRDGTCLVDANWPRPVKDIFTKSMVEIWLYVSKTLQV